MARKKARRKRNCRTKTRKKRKSKSEITRKPEVTPKPEISHTSEIQTKPVKFIYSSSNVTKLRLPIIPHASFENKFINYDEIEEYLKKMEKEFSGKCQLEIVGESVEGRPIYLAKISDGSGTHEKMLTLVEAGSNAYDWLAISSALYLVDFLTRDEHSVKLTDYYILPCSNPDAYHKCVNGERIDDEDIQIDLSNNFPLLLGTTTMEEISTDAFLKGLKTWKRNVQFFSPTTVAIFRAATCSNFSVKLFISLQEGGKNITYPFGFCNSAIPDEADLKKVANLAQKRLKKLKLNVGSIYEMHGLTYGTVIDFLKFSCDHIKFMYIVHIKDRRRKPNPADILTYGQDVLNCVRSMARNVFMYHNNQEVNNIVC